MYNQLIQMFNVILSLTISFSVTFLAIPIIIKVSEMKKLFDEPDERKIHVDPIPSLGGLGIFAGFVFACLLSISFTLAPEMQYYVAASLVIFFLGIKDDILVLSPIKKFIGQVLAAFIIIFKGGVQIKSMYGFMGIWELPEMFSLLLTYFTVIVIINSFNLIDGVDGLAGSLALVSTTMIGIYMVMANQPSYAVLAFSMAGSILAFLIFNFQPAKIFMGDTGSLLIGLVNAILVIKFINVASAPSAIAPISAAPAIGFALLIFPLMDTLRVFAIRIFQRRSPFSPDRNHIHHLLLDKGCTHRTITLLLTGISLVVIAACYTARTMGCTWLILILVLSFFSGIATLLYTSKKRRLFVAKRINGEIKSSSNVVPLTDDAVLEQK